MQREIKSDGTIPDIDDYKIDGDWIGVEKYIYSDKLVKVW